MGASNWMYLIPYQENIEIAFRRLQEQVFREGSYNHSWKFLEADDTRFNDHTARQEEFLQHTDKPLVELLPPPQTIEELQRRCGTAGTHSILDMKKIESKAKYLTLGPFPKEMMLTYIGTEYPNEYDIKEVFGFNDAEYSPELNPQRVFDFNNSIWAAIPNWTGFYTIVYRQQQPYKIFFAGWSGD